MTYGAQVWALSKEDEHKIKVAQNSMERNILNIKLIDKISTAKIKIKLNTNLDFLKLAKIKKCKWAGHLARISKRNWAKKVTFWQLFETRKKGKQKKRWRDGFKQL